jgi:hypothetical protein
LITSPLAELVRAARNVPGPLSFVFVTVIVVAPVVGAGKAQRSIAPATAKTETHFVLRVRSIQPAFTYFQEKSPAEWGGPKKPLAFGQ